MGCESSTQSNGQNVLKRHQGVYTMTSAGHVMKISLLPTNCKPLKTSVPDATAATPLHTIVFILLLFWNLSGTTRVSRCQKGKTRKGKTNLYLLEQEIVNGSGICWAICKSAPYSRQPGQHPTTQFFTGRMPFLPPNQQLHH